MRFRLARQARASQPEFSDSTRTALELARHEAAGLGNEYCGTEHLALSLLSPRTRGEAFIRSLGGHPDELRAAIIAKCKLGRESRLDLPYTSRAKKTLELAMQEATKAQADYVGVEFLLLGLILEEKGIAAQVLTQKAGLTADIVRRAILNPTVALFRVTLSDTSDASLTQQIVAQIEEGIATGQLKPGDRLQTVRSLADELEVAPGTVARAYTELEQRGAVITDGARGTRVAARTSVAVDGIQRVQMLSAMLRPVAVEGFHLGATADEFREALESAMAKVKLEPPDNQG